jgi:hypothetical protein
MKIASLLSKVHALCAMALSLSCGLAAGQGVDAPSEAASGAASTPPAIGAAAEAPAPPACRPLTDQAMAADLKAATAQAQRKSADDLAALYDAAAGLWQQAVERCEGRARERAQRNLKDTQKASAAIGELLGAGAACASTQRDADALQELAKQASADRRWPDAAILYRKAENMWDAASERCSGAQQQAALKRRDESETDGHNAEFCAPLFERARAALQRLRGAGSAAKPDEKIRLSLLAETTWRDATEQCRGAALDLARNNAQSLARERGTPWVVTREAPVTVAMATPMAAVPGRAAVGGATTATATTAPAGALAIGAAVVGGPGTAPVATPPPTPPTAQTMPPEFNAGSTRFVGRFVSDIGGTTYSGTGTVVWENGDRFTGTLRQGQRHGKGQFTWANGQHYDGDWIDDVPRGQGLMRFANGNRYEGAVAGGVPSGSGRMQYASGDSYVGELQRGTPNGRGTYEWLSGQRFDGDWRDGQAHGQGTLRFANGNRYEGTVQAGKPHGNGHLLFATGDAYTGSFQAGLPEGVGRFVWTNGDEYNGQWKAGSKDGQGVMLWKNGDRWEGTYRNDTQAEGTLTRKDG